jgi:transposase
MDSVKYIGMDVHKEAISLAVLNSSGKLVMEGIIEAKASSILQFFEGLRGSLQVTLEEGTWAAWLYDLLKPHVTNLVVCNPRRNALLKEGSKSDRIDARKLAELLRSNLLRPVYHGERRRAEFSYQQFDALRSSRQEVRCNLLAEAARHSAIKLLREIPFIGPIRAALLLAILQTPHRFRTKRQLWTYSRFGIETHSDSDNPWRTHWYAIDPSYLTVRVTFTKSDETAYCHALECHKSQFTTEEMQRFERDLDKGWAGSVLFRPWFGKQKSNSVFNCRLIC